MGRKSFIPLKREVVLDRVLCNPELKHPESRFLMYCIVRANFKNNLVTDKFGKENIIPRGSFCTSSEIIMKALNISDWRTYDHIRKKLKDKGYLNFYSNNGGTYFHVKDYNDYQDMPNIVPPVKLQKQNLDNSSTSTCESPEQIKIYTAEVAPSQQSIKKVPTSPLREVSLENENGKIELARPSDELKQHNIVSLNGKQINKDSDYFKQLQSMYGDYTDTWGFLIRTLKWVKDKNVKVNNVENFIESQLRKEKDRIVNLMFISEKGEDELQ